MRHPIMITLSLASMLALSACGEQFLDAEARNTSVNVIDENNLNDIMLAATDPNEAVSYFSRSVATDPDRIDLQRGLALSLVRAGRPEDALRSWKIVVAHDDVTNEDQVNYGGTLIRAGKWDQAESVLQAVPPTYETAKRYRLAAMVADSNQQWKKADSFYETASGLTTKPSGVYNNWGFSRLTRGDYQEAEKLFLRALRYDPSLFTAKNNLVLARGAQRNYVLPIIQMSQTERAQLLHTLALTAIKQNDVSIGKGLLSDAIETHPQYFEVAVRSLDALEANVTN
ncbi:tetratricopeptide repeat protein [Candidatus Halocynthiibacter alkanivorans]|uniref:tetratricopeptide repeat protein n=1 Tax=Candidatus Halocynthiibacter alkanivorans TaxID=2267619 RepID=UPI000DF16DB9|nr:tetratricopeptide repeat protein [Candidatus Halocynthiibacter alkanivorans]